MVKAFVVLNPVAGTSKPGKVRQAVTDAFDQTAEEITLHETDPDEDVTALVRERTAEDFDVIVAAGGDGTVSAVAAGLVGSDIPLGIVPTGSGNAVAYALGIPVSADRAVELIFGEHALRCVDAMEVNGTFRLLNAGLGFGASTMLDTSRESKRHLGRFAYIWTGIKKVFRLTPQRVTLSFDGTEHNVRAEEIMVLNIPGLGIPFIDLSDQVQPDDGQVNVLVLRARNLLDIVRLAWNLILRRHRRDPGIDYYSSTGPLRIDSGLETPVQADGEIIGTTPLEITVKPQAVNIIVPVAEAEAEQEHPA